jgi:hypothetical protein
MCHILQVLRFFLGYTEWALPDKSSTIFYPGTNANQTPHPFCDRLFIVCLFVDQLESLAATAIGRGCALAPSRDHFRHLLPAFHLLIDWPVRFLDYLRSPFSGNPQYFPLSLSNSNRIRPPFSTEQMTHHTEPKCSCQSNHEERTTAHLPTHKHHSRQMLHTRNEQ